MSLVTNGFDLLSFFSEYPTDKVVQVGSISIVNDGITSNAPQSSKIVTDSTPNTYGRKSLVRFKYSVDGGTNYQSQESHLVYSYTITITSIPVTTIMGGLRAAVSVGVSDSTIFFRTANGYHGNSSRVLPADPDVYTCISQTFNIVYALYERE